ncbi:MAG: OmpH family outer membrane protein [Hahellaceae bacterium]|nr:OmpH family outer membrane protein [Hahellaceae bacterium]
MKRRNWLAVAGGLMLSATAMADLKVAVIDVRSALFTSDAAKEFSKSLMDEFKTQEMEVRSVQEEGAKLQERLKKDAAIMSDAERNKLIADLEEKAKEFKYLRSKLDAAINARKQEFLQTTKPKVDKVLEAMVKESKLDVILPREAVIYAKPELDMTAKLIEKLNKAK